MARLGRLGPVASIRTPSDMSTTNCASSPARSALTDTDTTCGAALSAAAWAGASTATAVPKRSDPTDCDCSCTAPASEKSLARSSSLALSPVLMSSIWFIAAFWAARMRSRVSSAACGLVATADLALPVSVSIRLLVEATAVPTAALALLSLASSMLKRVGSESVAVCAALVRMAVSAAESSMASADPLDRALSMALTMPPTMKSDRLDSVGASALLLLPAPLSAAAPTAMTLATIRALLLISSACVRLMPEAASSCAAEAVAMVSIRVRSTPSGRSSASLTLAMAEALAWARRSSASCGLSCEVSPSSVLTMDCTRVVSGLTTVLPGVAL